MEAATLKKKKSGLSKGKLKKTIKNVLCRPDPIFWPVISEEEEKGVRIALNKYKVDIPNFVKPHWKELKQMTKAERPKPPKIKKPEGLIFGVSECGEAVKSNSCSAVLLDSEVNPRFIVQPIIEACALFNAPFLCITHLKKVCFLNFGIKTVCLGVQTDCLPELVGKIDEFFKKLETKLDKNIPNEIIYNKTNTVHKMPEEIENSAEITCLHLFRSNKKSRAFVPPADNDRTDLAKKGFIGQNFIEFSEPIIPQNQASKDYKNMLLKRLTSNPNRVKAGKKKKTK